MDKEDFLEQAYCDRCKEDLSARTTSWFNKETICIDCSMWEDKIIENREESRAELEGWGYVPEVEVEINWGENPE